MNPNIVFFDCDGVLMFGNPWVKLHREMNISYELDKKWFDDYFFGKISFDKWNENVENQYKREKLTRNFFEESMDLKNFILNDEAWDLIYVLKEKQIPTVIISNGIDYYVEKVAKYFHIDYWSANAHFDFDKNGNFKRIVHKGKGDDAKVAAINKISTKLKVNPQDSFYIGDSVNDLTAFKFTKRGILYETKFGNHIRDEWTRLDDSIIQAAWKRITDLKEVKTFL